MRRGRAAGLAALAALLLVAGGRAQVQQEPFLETTEGTGINITCSHSNKQIGETIHFYRQLPGRAPEFLALVARGSKDVPAIAGRLSVSEDGRWSALWLAGPRRGDAAVYYCALGATGRGAGAAAGHEPPRAGPGGASRGRCRSARRAPGARLRSSFLCPEPARTDTARPRTAPARLTTARNPRSHARRTQPGLPSLPSPPLPHAELLRAAPLPPPLALRPRLLLLSACSAKPRAAP